jgi:nitroimidazol reductase NimA-like FMN-containing flavoprotein (pyridoxamine 5'-phosphate oxidase superfamily)
MPEMSKTEIDAFLARPVLARIATVRGDRPHVVPMWFDWDGESIWMETGFNFQKHKNLLANPNCAVTIDVTAGGLRFKGVILEGKAEIITEPPQLVRETVVRIYTKYLGREGIEAPTPRRMIESPHAIIKLTPARITSWDDTATGLAPLP